MIYVEDHGKPMATAGLKGKLTDDAMGYLDLEAQAEIVPSPHTSWWYRQAVSDSWWFEKVDSEWYISPEHINFYMSALRS